MLCEFCDNEATTGTCDGTGICNDCMADCEFQIGRAVAEAIDEAIALDRCEREQFEADLFAEAGAYGHPW